MKNVISIVKLGAVLGAVAALSGCASIRVVKASKQGGVIALVGDREKAMELARTEMARTCGGPSNYDVQEEGEAVIGEVSDSSGRAHQTNGLFGPGVSSSSHTETTQKTEWRVTYSCKGAAPAAPAGAPTTTTDGKPTGQLHTLIIRY